MKIHVVRHAHAVGLGGGIFKDSDRTLSDLGVSEARALARGLKISGVKADLVASSTLTRAKQTAEILQSELGGVLESTDALTPPIDFSRLCNFLSKQEKVDSIFCVSHEPDVGLIVKDLISGGLEFSLPFQPASVCCVEVFDLPPTVAGTLRWMVTAEMIASLVNVEASSTE